MNDSIHIDSSKNSSCPMKAEVVPLIHTNNLFFIFLKVNAEVIGLVLFLVSNVDG